MLTSNYNLSVEPLFTIDGTQYWPIFLNTNINGIEGQYIIKGPFQRPDTITVQFMQPVKRSYGGERQAVANFMGKGISRGSNAAPSLRTSLQQFPDDTTLEQLYEIVDRMNARHSVIQSHLRYKEFSDTPQFTQGVTMMHERLMAEEGLSREDAIVKAVNTIVNRQKVAVMNDDGTVAVDKDGKIVYLTHKHNGIERFVYRKYTLHFSPVADINETTAIGEMLTKEEIDNALLASALAAATSTSNEPAKQAAL